MTSRRICVVTGTRADYGLLYWVMKEIAAAPDLELQIVTTGMHLSPEFGLTWQRIEEDGFTIDATVEMLLSSDTGRGIAKSMGLGVIGFADAFERLQPDLLVLLGDRFEMFAAAQTALVMKIPVAHIAGGDTTEGAYDEALRHGITKMAHLHFVTNADAARRVGQLGEAPGNIHNVGSPGLDYIHRMRLLPRVEIERRLNCRFHSFNLLVTFHPATLERSSPAEQFAELLAALDTLGPDVGIFMSRPNADNGSRELIRMLDAFAASRQNVYAWPSLGQELYLSLMAQVDMVIGNSSSGLYEAPSFKKPTVNIGDRQRGRLRAASVVDCAPRREAIGVAITQARALDCSQVSNPYGDGDSAKRIVGVLRRESDYRRLLIKSFVDWAGDAGSGVES